MPTIVDSLIVELGLDTSKFTEGQKKAVTAAKDMEESIGKSGKAVEKSVKNMGDSFAVVTRALGELTLGFLTVSGVSSFVSSTNQVNTALGQQATLLGMTAVQLEKYKRAAQLSNVPPESMVNTLNSLYRGMFGGLGGNPTDQMFSNAAMMGMDPGALRSKDPAALLRAINQAYISNPLHKSQGQLQSFMQGMGVSDAQISMIERLDGSMGRMLDKADKMKTLTADQIQKSTEATSAWNHFVGTMTDVGNIITRDIDGPLTGLLNWLDSVAGKLDKFIGLIEILGGLLTGTALGAAVGAILGIPFGPGGMAAGAIIGGRIGAGIGLGAGAAAAVEHYANPDPNAGIAGGRSGGSADLAKQREPFKQELANDPSTRDLVASMISREDPQNKTAAVESLFNRTAMVNEQRAARGLPPLSVRDMILGHHSIDHGKSFYSIVRDRSIFQGIRGNASQMYGYVDDALAGSNVIGSHTDQGNPGDQNYESGGGITFRNRERYGDWQSPFGSSRAWREKQERGTGGASGGATQAPSESWGHWIGQQLTPYWRGGGSGATTNNKQSSLSIGNMNFHGVRDMNDVAQNIEPYIKNRLTAIASDHGYA